ncbi:MAG: formylglycine-generating enzyme family protein, partial [Candidatus Electrothrix sp. AR4]|nr:formylglycine-generating enzyme family protein [Candidatus Electrothrix sp. AR4]
LLDLKKNCCGYLPERKELFHAFVRLARWMEEHDRIEIAEKDLWELFFEDANTRWFEKFKSDRSLLNKNSNQAFRFSHSTYREFLLAYALINDRRPFSSPVRATEQLVRFLDLAGGISKYINKLNLSEFNPFRYIDTYGTLFSWRDKLGRTPKRIVKGPEMIMLPGGRFKMGDIQGGGSGDALPVHEVELDSFALSCYPITFEEYDLFCRATDRHKPKDNGWGRKRRPVFNVSWQDANNYCEWLSQITGKPYRLPTEAEWEYACRAGGESIYFFGNDEDRLGRYAWYSENADGRTHPVGKKGGNAWGLYDMYGNIWEWCSDSYDKNYYTDRPVRNPTGAEQGAGRVLRGGSWDSGERFIRSSFRFCLSPGLRIIRVGFRIARGYIE